MDNHSEFHNAIDKKIKAEYPNLKTPLNKYFNVFSENEITLDASIYQDIKLFISSVFKLTHMGSFQDVLFNKYPSKNNYINKNCKNYSLLMSYDFHINADNKPKLIEINTNASSYTIGNIISVLKYKKSYIKNLKESFEMEINSSGANVQHIAIIDENPKEQKLYLEFLIYKEIIQSWGYKCTILDVNNLIFKNDGVYDTENQKIDLIYNRYCDFYLQNDDSTQLRHAFLNNQVVLSPNPNEYFFLADKQRMIDLKNLELENWLNNDEINSINNVLLTTLPISALDPEQLWKNKKKYFFKPKNSFGGKSVYRGQGVTKKVFERLLNEETLVQEYVPPPKVNYHDSSWKYDLRVYCYKDKIDQIIARTYKGQTTNANTVGGGISLVHFQ